MREKLKKGLRELPEDPRDFTVGALFDLPDPATLPAAFQFDISEVKDQRNSDFCSAYATCYASELQEVSGFEPSWSFAVSKMLSNDVDAWGQNLRDAMSSHVKYGALCSEDAPFNLNNEDINFLRRINNWPKDLFVKAEKNKKQTFLKVTGPYDDFDNIRATIWKFREEKRAVVIGLVWSWKLAQEFLDKPGRGGFGHAVCVIGWNDRGIVIQNSAGLSAGKGGQHTVSREVINTYCSQYGAFMFVDLPREQAQYLTDNGIKVGDNWIVALIKAFLALFKPRTVRN